MKALSIVLVSWNTKDILRNCLISIQEQTKDIEYEVIVVDNASEDDSTLMVRTEFPDVILIENKTNVGFAAANNIGFKQAGGEYVLLLNSDTIVLDGALNKTLSYAKSKPQYGIISCRVLNADLTIQPNCFMLPSILNSLLFVLGLYKLLPRNRFCGRAEMTWWDYNDERDVEVIKGCFMLVKSEALREVGDMDEQFFMYSEEIDWCYRYSTAGWKIGFYPDANIIHLGGASAARLGADRAKIKDRSNLRYMRKHWPTTHFYIGIVLLFMFYLSRLPLVAGMAALTGNKKYRKIVANHWSGLLGLISLSTIKNSEINQIH